MLGLAIAWALFVPVADWLARHDVGSVKGSLHETAVDNARGRLLTLGAGLFAAGALVFTARNFALSREGQVTDRYTKAIEQLGSDKLDGRIGGIYALERVARDSARDHPTVMEVLTAFIREHSREQWPLPAHGTPRTMRPDIQAAVTVVGYRDPRRDINPIDLTGAVLTGAVLTGASLTRAVLAGADLSGAMLPGINLTSADLTGAVLTGAVLTSAHLDRAHLGGADLTRASLPNATLAEATLFGTNLTDANLDGADLTGVNLRGGVVPAITAALTLTSADLPAVVLTGASFDGADLTGARWHPDTPIPEGWTLAPGSDRLKRANAGSGPAEAD